MTLDYYHTEAKCPRRFAHDPAYNEGFCRRCWELVYERDLAGPARVAGLARELRERVGVEGATRILRNALEVVGGAG